jgi:hypothetical protein
MMMVYQGEMEMNTFEDQEAMDAFFATLIAEEVLMSQQKRIESFLFDNAETRYLDFVRENPDVFNRISLSHLSSYLGIERQSLTRIRKKLTRS